MYGNSFRFFLYYNPNKCSIRIFRPMRISMTPPVISAYFPSFPPILFPRNTAAALMKKVVTPIRQTAERISTFRNAKLIPTAKASILVAIASRKISFVGMDSIEVSHSDAASFDSRIILTPIKPSRKNAIQ